MHGWTPERKKRQSQMIHTWRPWEKATGAKTPEGKKRVSQNGLKHGNRTTEAIALKSAIAEIGRMGREAAKLMTEHGDVEHE